MRRFDFVALTFVAFIIALTFAGELKDLRLCSIAIEHAGDKLAPGWRIALRVLGGVRRWVFLPCLVLTIPMLIFFQGGE